MSGFAVVDLETTGFSPRRGDRIVEIAIVSVTPDGQIESEWTSLVDPCRDVGPTRIHGIRPQDVYGAPTFADLAPQVVQALAGRVIVAHNAAFDTLFLQAELVAAGIPLTGWPPSICTMTLSSHFLAAASRRLEDCCAAAGVDNALAHSALGDARATAELLQVYLADASGSSLWRPAYDAAVAFRWPTWAVPPVPVPPRLRTSAGQVRPADWLDRVTAKTSRSDHPGAEDYLAVLDQALLDRYLSGFEQDGLVELAGQLGLSRDDLDRLHRRYLTELAGIAWQDGMVTDAELADLHRVAALLGLPGAAVEQTLARAHDADRTPSSRAAAADPEQATAMDRPGRGSLRLAPGDRIAFTGQMRHDRAQWEGRARAAGLVVAGVSRATKVLVAADPDSRSGKATTARAYRLPIVTEDAFEATFDAFVRH